MQAIFLTSYAEFDFARRAIALDSVDYLLKPIDFTKLTAAIRKASDRAKAAQNYQVYRQESRIWEQNREILLKNFWSELLSGRMKRSAIEEEIKKGIWIINRRTGFWQCSCICPAEAEERKGNTGMKRFCYLS
ncbi:MAG: hypothetical protein ACLRMZ_16680 [Blautia marasmi]